MSNCKIYPSDKVGLDGHVYPTVGENIRKGLFGLELKQGVIDINNGNVTSPDFAISTGNSDYTFYIDRIAIILYPISCAKGNISCRISLFPKGKSLITTTVKIADISGKIMVLYTEE